ncbi:MAG: FG-GAP-like repeat-containing protein, partial [Mariprofundales bacterium]|nr:FG-GAP-like repeat-containing protein [Mariprofundales bacterium]
ITNIRIDEESSDADGDGLPGVLAEYSAYGTDPFLADTDGDGVSDSREVAAGSDPLLASSLPAATFSATPWVQSLAGLAPDDLLTFDMTSDGYSDVLLAGLTPGSAIYQMTNINGASLGVVTAISPTLSAAYRLAVADLNGDSYTDLVAVSNSVVSAADVYVMLNNQSGVFSVPVASSDNYAVTTQARSVATADLNGDGYTDLVLGYLNQAVDSVLLGSASGAMTYYGSYARIDSSAVSAPHMHIVLTDFNGDGYADLVDGVSIALGDGSGGFGAPVSLGIVGTNIQELIAGDLNGDGYSDLVVGDVVAGVSTVRLMLGNGDGTFATPGSLTVGSSLDAIALGDLNQDGRLDMAVADPNASTIYIYHGNGDGSFTTDTPVVTAGAKGVKITDMNGDGQPDLVVYESSGVVLVWLNSTYTTVGGALF